MALKVGAEAKKKRRENQYRLQLMQRQGIQARLLKENLSEAAAQKELEYGRLSQDLATGEPHVNMTDYAVQFWCSSMSDASYTRFCERSPAQLFSGNDCLGPRTRY